MPPFGWNIIIAWSQPNSNRKYWPTLLASTSASGPGPGSGRAVSFHAPG